MHNFTENDPIATIVIIIIYILIALAAFTSDKCPCKKWEEYTIAEPRGTGRDKMCVEYYNCK